MPTITVGGSGRLEDQANVGFKEPSKGNNLIDIEPNTAKDES